mgnify:FL=1
MKRNNVLTAFLAFGMYFLTGAACIVVGSSLTHLAEMYDMSLDKVVLLGSAYAFGRVLTVYGTGHLVEKIGTKKVLGIGVILIMAYLIGLPLVVNFYAGMFFACLGGIGMGAQDTVCPVLLSAVFKRNYAGSLSVGQAMFGLGSFATPFLIGILLTWHLPFYGAYYILLVIPVLMLICIPFVHLQEHSAEGKKTEQVEPLYTKSKLIAWGALLILCAAYSAVVNTLGLYISSFAESIGISSANAAFMLTVYNVGSVTGSFVFVLILRKVKPQTVLIINNLFALAAVVLVLGVDHTAALFSGFLCAGFFLGVLFSVIVTVATRIGYERISIASSIVATAGGGSDILTPIITGFLVGRMGIRISFYYTALMIVISLAAALLIKINTSEKKKEE